LVRRIVSKPGALVIAGGVILLVFALVGLHSSAFPFSKPATRSSVVEPGPDQSSAKTIQPENSTATPLPASESTSSPSEASTTNTAGTADPGSECSLDFPDRQNAYNRDLKKEKANLDNILGGVQVGTMINGKFVQDYNDKITKLYDQYKGDLANAHCTVEVKNPELLPATYPY
jgi:hypothetical protein